jgi:hypothetical protein
MKSILTPIVAASVATCALYAAPPSPPLTGAERTALALPCDAELLELRAGAPADTSPVAGPERAALRRAESADPALLELRAGMHLTQDEWFLIGVAATVVILVAILA